MTPKPAPVAIPTPQEARAFHSARAAMADLLVANVDSAAPFYATAIFHALARPFQLKLAAELRASGWTVEEQSDQRNGVDWKISAPVVRGPVQGLRRTNGAHPLPRVPKAVPVSDERADDAKLDMREDARSAGLTAQSPLEDPFGNGEGRRSLRG